MGVLLKLLLKFDVPYIVDTIGLVIILLPVSFPDPIFAKTR